MNYPLVIFVVAFALMAVAAWIGGRLGEKRRHKLAEIRDDFNNVQAATLALLGLIIGFSFSMATGRYDQRKNYEEAEANAIGTEYLRVDLIPGTDTAALRRMLVEYTDLRIHYYTAGRTDPLTELNAATEDLQNRMWLAVSRPVMSHETAPATLAVAGMNDVINSQGYTQAAWWNRLPVGAWALMFIIAMICNGMLGYGAKRWDLKLFLLLPAVVGVAFFLIADIDSPRGGVIRITPQNLISLREGFGK